MAERFLNGRVELHCGDMLAVLPAFEENCIDAGVCDPPYHLSSIVKRFGAPDAAPAKIGKTGSYARASSGFMGKQWDGGDIAFQVDTWRQVLRVLKPGAHLIAFSSTRTYHRMACAIEDAGFEIRDQIGWCYGSGFPKSHDVSKGIDKRRDWALIERLSEEIRRARHESGLSLKDIGLATLDATADQYGAWYHRGGHMFFETGRALPSRPEWDQLRRVLPIRAEFIGVYDEAEREITGEVEEWTDRTNYAMTSKDGFRRDKPSSDLALQWEGWGTALKPAMELICVARKPLSEPTIAANVLKWGTGAINVDGCRVPSADDNPSIVRRNGAINHLSDRPAQETEAEGRMMSRQSPEAYRAERPGEQLGRWPANIIHDGSAEVLAGFPNAKAAYVNSASAAAKMAERKPTVERGVTSFDDGKPCSQLYTDSGSAARFFYTAKADTDDRLGSKHPTVKPLDLMQYLVRLVTPPGGTVLDCFAGTGTTGEAAFREGMRAVLIEREAEYQADIRRRMALVLAGPDERAREAIKERMKDKPRDDGPLFGGAE